LQPHLILAVTTAEFNDVLVTLENAWNGAYGASYEPAPLAPPFYVFSPFVPRSTVLDRAQEFETPPGEPPNPAFIPMRQRILGVTAAGAEDTSLYDAYLNAFKAKYGSLGLTLDGTENFYDAAWYTMYAIHGGVKTANLSGRDVASGMNRLLGGGTDWEIFNDDSYEVIKDLRSGDQDGFITLYGTMGPPDFRPSGARTGLPGIYCIDLDPMGSGNEMAYYQDALRYNPDDQSLYSPSGNDPCSIDGFMGEP